MTKMFSCSTGQANFLPWSWIALKKKIGQTHFLKIGLGSR
jgi:hypothetical protein